MYVQRTFKRVKDKTYTTILLMKSIRVGKKVDHKTIANITKWPPHIISALEFSLKGGKIEELKEIGEYQRKQGKSYGALKVIVEVARMLGIDESLGRNKKKILALIMIASQIISPRSRWYIANFWSKSQAIDEVFKKEVRFDEDDLYETLAWLSENQAKIEERIWKKRLKENHERTKTIFLYDVTSTYVEGEKMALTDYGYPRGAVKGKKQIVIGLLTDKDGDPLVVEVFRGNTNDYKTVVNQLEKIKKNYGAERVVFVGDRGMIKSEQIKEITEEPLRWNYITAITKSQIEKMISDGIIQLGLFDEKLCEIENNGIRYIMRRNPIRAEEIEKNLEARIACIEKKIEAKNKYLKEHPRAKKEIALENLNLEINRRQLKKIITIEESEDDFRMRINEESKEDYLKLAGCYVIKTDVSAKELDKEVIHARYKDLTKVEKAFKTIKSGLLEIRPIHVRKEETIRGHVFVCMLALKITQYIESKLKELDYPLRFIIEILDKIQYTEEIFKNYSIKRLPDILEEAQTKILKGLEIKLPVQL